MKREVIDLPQEQRAGLIKIREEITEQPKHQPSQFYPGDRPTSPTRGHLKLLLP